jgi:hypothetical protein
MGQIFDNRATRTRTLAWGIWLLFAAVVAGVACAPDNDSYWRRPCLVAALAMGSWLILVRLRPRKLPVLNYHSVSEQSEWLRLGDRVAITPAAFERQLTYLERRGYRSLFISEAFQLLAGTGDPVPSGKCVALTFDDGYADNWLAAFPLLKKHGMKATLFISTDFITDADGCRPTVEGLHPADGKMLDWSGYLTWPELKAMQASGLVEIQSHGSAHARVFAESALLGFVGPGKPNRWLLWNICNGAQAGWWRDGGMARSLWGHPVFRQVPALAHRAWNPAPEAVARLMGWGRDQGESFFDQPDWEQRLRATWREMEKDHGSGEREGSGDYERRVEIDLRNSRQRIEERLGWRSDILCWPENAFSTAGETIAHRVGYVATVSNRHDSRNAVGETPGRIARVFVGCRAAGFDCPWLDVAAFVLELKVFEGWYVLYPLLAMLHTAKKAAFAVRRRCKCRMDDLSIWG